jgi:hypothetical protein
MNKLFVLLGSCGSYDDYRRINIGVYDSEDAAKEAADKFLKKRNDILNNVNNKCPLTPDQLRIVEETYETDGLTESEIDSYYSWQNIKYMMEEINNDYYIEEFILNVDTPENIMDFDVDDEYI